MLLGTSVSWQAAWTLGGANLEFSAEEFAKKNPPKKVILKVYDEDIHTFKLTDLVTVVGVLEFQQPDAQADSQMTDMQAGEELSKGPANAEAMPNIHVLGYASNYTLNSLPQLPKKQVSAETISKNSQRLNEASQKILAVLSILLKGDKIAAKYLFAALISRVYNRESGLFIGNLAANLTGINEE